MNSASADTVSSDAGPESSQDYTADGTRPSAATRYLAAAAYTDKPFRDKAIEMDEEPFRARAPELGIDVGLVLKHCRIARRRTAWRDFALCVVLILLAFTGIFGDLLHDPSDTPLILQSYFVPLVICWLLAAAIVFTVTFRTQHITLTRRFARNAFARNAFARTPEALPSKPANPSNVVIYGGFSPFVGSGFGLEGWSFTVNLEQVKLDFESDAPEPFEIDELYDALRKGFERVAIDGLSINDRLFVDGQSIREDRRFLPSLFARPVTNVDPALVEAYRTQPSKTVRHYLCLDISDWGGEVVLSTFIRVQKSASKLFIETSNFLLPPLKRQYYDLDKHTSTRLPGKIVDWLVQAAITGPFLALFALFDHLEYTLAATQQYCRPAPAAPRDRGRSALQLRCASEHPRTWH